MLTIQEQITQLDKIIKITLSDTTSSAPYKKIIIRPIIIKDKELWQIEQYTLDKVFHKNLDFDSLITEFLSIFPQFRQIAFYYEDRTITYSKKGNGYKFTETQNTISIKLGTHDNQKNYILNEGDNIPALVDLGVFNSNFCINKSKYDKFKQINRFVEIINDAFVEYDQEEITILDFGCGKSYLTFILYHYFVNVKHINAQIIGYDLKEDVVEHCNEIAQKYGYRDLHFYVNDVSRGDLYRGKIDMIISLHACDTATDYALDFAIKNNVKYIFSVPCCQHEINKHITPANSEYDILLKHGIIKERFSALLTDAIRAEILHQKGYRVDMLEFVDFSHSPKNIMIRAQKTKNSNKPNYDIDTLSKKYKFSQTLLKLNKE